MSTGTRAAALVAMIRNLDGDFKAQCQLVGDALKLEREDCAKLADLQAALDRRRGETLCKDLPDDAQSYEDFAVTAESIARSIRNRTNLEK